MKILVAEDDPGVRQALTRALEFEGYAVVVAEDGAGALDAVKRDAPDVIVLDVMMPFIDGLEACRRLRSRGVDTPILMLTARHEVADRVEGLEAGADDYLVKPFALEELLARIQALLRRTGGHAPGTVLESGGLEMNLETRVVTRGPRRIELTMTEFQLLELLMENEGIVLSRDVIYQRIWGYDFGTTSNSLDVYIGYLRRKTEQDGEPRLIQTVRGVGYVLRSQ